MLITIILYFGGIILSAFLFALEEFSEWRKKMTSPKLWDVREHWFSIPQRASIFLLGLTYPFGYWEAMFVLGVYWLFTDGLMNKLKGRKFFAVSNESGNPLEKLNVVKHGLLIIGLVVMLSKNLIWS